jgi:hypothetical protein
MNKIAYRARRQIVVDAALRLMEELERLLPWWCMPPCSWLHRVRALESSPCMACQGIQELTCPGPHDLHGATVPCGFLSRNPPHWGPTKRAGLFWSWCTHELGPNGCRNLDRDAHREVKTHFILTRVGRFCWCFSWGLDIQYAALSGVGNSSRLPTHIPSSKTRPRHSDPPPTVTGPP